MYAFAIAFVIQMPWLLCFPVWKWNYPHRTGSKWTVSDYVFRNEHSVQWNFLRTWLFFLALFDSVFTLQSTAKHFSMLRFVSLRVWPGECYSTRTAFEWPGVFDRHRNRVGVIASTIHSSALPDVHLSIEHFRRKIMRKCLFRQCLNGQRWASMCLVDRADISGAQTSHIEFPPEKCQNDPSIPTRNTVYQFSTRFAHEWQRDARIGAHLNKIDPTKY